MNPLSEPPAQIVSAGRIRFPFHTTDPARALLKSTVFRKVIDIYHTMIYIDHKKNMPAVSFYLPEEVLKALREEAKARRTSVSRLIRTSVETQLRLEERKRAKGEFLKAIRSAGLGTWEEAHKERTRESDDRS